MPHQRTRHLSQILLHLSKMSSLIGILGHRQVGKTTLLEQISNHYVSLDDEEMLNEANNEPKKFISSLKSLGTAIDECQLSAKIFPALKERVRQDKRPGQFYLSGSVRFTSKKLIKESLTGRIMNTELLPLTLSELDGIELPDLAIKLLQSKKLTHLSFNSLSGQEHLRRTKLIQQYQSQGGLPGVCFIRNDKLRTQKIMDQLETILDRDTRQVHDTTLTLPELIRFIRQVAIQDGSPIQFQNLRRATGITPNTQKKLLYALEATFILRHIPIEGDMNGSAIFFEDQAEVSTLAQNQLSEEQQWSGIIYRNLREQIMYRLGENADFFQYRTRGGIVIPFVIRSSESSLAVIPIRGEPSRSALGHGQSFLRRYADGKVIFVTDSNTVRAIDERTLLLPATQLLF